MIGDAEFVIDRDVQGAGQVLLSMLEMADVKARDGGPVSAKLTIEATNHCSSDRYDVQVTRSVKA